MSASIIRRIDSVVRNELREGRSISAPVEAVDGQVIPAGPAPAGVPAIKTTIPTAKPVPEPAAPPVQD